MVNDMQVKNENPGHCDWCSLLVFNVKNFT